MALDRGGAREMDVLSRRRGKVFEGIKAFLHYINR